MKKLIMVFTLMTLMAVLGSTAEAVTVNPAAWNFYLESLDASDDDWTSTTNVPDDFSLYDYDYDWQLTQAQIRVEGDGVPLQWLSILGLIADTNGFGTEEELPFDIFSPSVGALHIEVDGTTADIYLGVSIGGYGEAYLDKVVFGQIEVGGGKVADVTGMRFGGDLNVTAVPEPATIVLLSLAGLVLLRKRRV